MIEAIRNSIIWAVEWLADFLQAIVDFFTGLLWAIVGFGISMGNMLVLALPDIGDILSQQEYITSITLVMNLVGRMNQFFPVVEAFVLLSIYLYFMMTFLVVKLILKLIPTIG